MSFSKQARLCAMLALPAMLFTLVFYRHGLYSWFQADDFAWLSLWTEVHSARDLFTVLFQPRAQGSIRPLSERAYFLGLQALFGWNPVPFRAVAFATQMVNLTLLASLTLRLTASRLAAGLAPLFWAAASALAVPMMWNSVYNQLLCAGIFLAALRCWIAYCDSVDTGKPQPRLLWIQYGIFALGFTVLESIVIYPVLAMSWVAGTTTGADLWRRWRALLPMFALSALYTLLHQAISPVSATGAYALHLDASMITTLARYLSEVFGGPLLRALPVAHWLQLLGTATPFLIGVPLIAFIIGSAARRGVGAILVPLALLLAPLVPVLPLRDHFTHYYLVTPAAGLAMVLAWCCAEWSRGRWTTRAAAAAMAVGFLVMSMIPAAWQRNFWFDRGQGIRTLMLGLAQARQLHPGKELVVAGLDGGRFYGALTENAARALGLGRVYLTPGSAENIDPLPGEPDAATFELAWPALTKGLSEGTAVVYATSGDRLRNVSAVYRAIGEAHRDAAANRVEPAAPLYRAQLGDGWLGLGGDARWMGDRATVYLLGQTTDGKSAADRPLVLVVEGYCPEVQFSHGSFRIRAVVNRTSLEQQVVAAPGGLFRLKFLVPRDFVVTDQLQVALEADHVVALPDGSHASVLISAIIWEQL